MPGIYHASFHSESYRSSRPANAVTFAANDDGAAAAVAAELDAWTAGRLTSLTKELSFNRALPYPLGTRVTMNALAQDATEGVGRFVVRDVHANVTEIDVVALLTGTVGASGLSAGFSALSAPPSLLDGAAIVSVPKPGLIVKS